MSVKAREAAQYDKYGLKLHKPQQGRSNGVEGGSKAHLRRFAHVQLSLATSNSLNLLTLSEKQLCAQLHILPKPYLFIKQAILREYARKAGRYRRSDARSQFRFNPDKINAIYDHLFCAKELRKKYSPTPTPAPNGASVVEFDPFAEDEIQPSRAASPFAMQVDEFVPPVAPAVKVEDV
jgi:hypothetical protein